MVPRVRAISSASMGRIGPCGSLQRPRRAPGHIMSSLKVAAIPAGTHGNQSHFQHYVRESGQGLRGLRPQGQPRRACSASSRWKSSCSASAPRSCSTPREERIKSEFAGVKRTFLPLHSVLRIDEVKKQGVSKITALEGGATSPSFPCRCTRAPPEPDEEVRAPIACCRFRARPRSPPSASPNSSSGCSALEPAVHGLDRPLRALRGSGARR